MELKFLLLSALALAATASVYFYSQSSESVNELNSFRAYSQQYKKHYASLEELDYRRSIFADNLAFISMRNKEQSSFELGINQFTDMTFEEFSRFYLMETIPNEPLTDDTPVQLAAGGKDWRQDGKVTHVKNQAHCGSCWAFSATGGLESAIAIKTGKLGEYSEQELVDCSRTYGNMGCNGGLMSYAYKYVHDKKLATEADYPYKGVDQTCKASQKGERVTVTGFKTLPQNDVASLVAEIQKQPVPVAIEVQRDFMSYKSGIYRNANCGRALNHGVLAAGFVSDGDNSYFIVKNSWSVSWGDQGYIKMAFGTGSGTCGIANGWDAIPVV